MRKITISNIIVLVFLISTVLNAFAVPPPSAGSILSQERQEGMQENVQRLEATPHEETIETPAGTDTGSKSTVSKSQQDQISDEQASCATISQPEPGEPQ